ADRLRGGQRRAVVLEDPVGPSAAEPCGGEHLDGADLVPGLAQAAAELQRLLTRLQRQVVLAGVAARLPEADQRVGLHAAVAETPRDLEALDVPRDGRRQF